MGTRHPATRWSLLYKVAHSAVRITIQRSLSSSLYISPLPSLPLSLFLSLASLGCEVTDCPLASVSDSIFLEAVREALFPFRSFASVIFEATCPASAFPSRALLGCFDFSFGLRDRNMIGVPDGRPGINTRRSRSLRWLQRVFVRWL